MAKRPILCGVAAALLLAVAAQAQTTFATITGTVSDSTGAVVPNVAVTARNAATGIETSTKSNEAGIYTLAQLREGEYTLHARGAGFKEFVAQNIVLQARDIRRMDVRLEVGALETSVEVSAGITLIETETARISDTKTVEDLKSIPVNARWVWSFLALAPTVISGRYAGSISNQSHMAIDGTTMADGVSGSIGPLADHIESFQEVKIDMSNNTAEFGPIGEVTIISKSGTNSFHGNISDYYATPLFMARNPFAQSRPTGISHKPGGSLGAPVLLPKLYNGRNRTFVFFSFETKRGSQVNDFVNPTVPLASWREGDFSGLNVKIYDPTTGQPFANNKIPASRINAVSKKLQDRFYPLPNYGDSNVLTSQNYRQMLTRPFDSEDYWILRGDHHFSERDSVFGRFTYLRTYEAHVWQDNLPTIGKRWQRRDDRAATAVYTHTFSPTLLSETRWGFALNNNPYWGPLNGPEFVKEFGLVGLAPNLPDISGMLNVSFSGLGLQGLTQDGYNNPGYRNHLQDFQEHVSWFRGKHNVKMGLNVTRIEYDNMSSGTTLFGSVSFSNRFTSGGVSGQGHPYADFLLGIPTTASRAFPPVRVDRSRWQYDFFFQDDIKLTPKLTANVGTRYEYHPSWVEQHGRSALFDINTGQIVIQDGSMDLVSPLLPKGYVGVVEAKTVGLPGSRLLRTDKNNFAPRIGLAYRPWGDKTVFRSGFGVFYNIVPSSVSQGGIPYVLNEPSYTNPTTNPDVIFPRVFPATGTGGPSTVSLPGAVNPGLPVPYSLQWNFTIEHARWDTGFRLSYIGTNTRQASWSYDINSPVPDNRLYVDKPRLFPKYPGISYTTNGAGHQYNAMLVEADRKMVKGLHYQISWVWARDITVGSSENPYGARVSYVATDIPTHRVTSNWIYELPVGKGRKFLGAVNRPLNAVVGGWQISGVYSYHSGQFLSPSFTGPDPTGTSYTTSRTAPNVTRLPDILRDPNLPRDQRTVDRWFDTAAFAAPTAGQFGNSANNVIKGPWVNVWHMGVFKKFMFVEERVQLRWELTSTNVFNHPNWSNPSRNISTPTSVGRITGVGGVNGGATGDVPGPRTVQLGVRLEW